MDIIGNETSIEDIEVVGLTLFSTELTPDRCRG